MNPEPRNILLFDDDYESMEPLKLFLEVVHGFTVELTAAQTILQRLTEKRFDLLCVDLMIHPVSLDAAGQEVENLHFPDVNWQVTGLEFLKRLRRGDFCQQRTGGTAPQVPVIVLSAVATQSIDAMLKQEVQPLAHIEKPFDLEEMIACIDQLLRTQP